MKIILLPCLTFMYVTLINDMPGPVTARRAAMYISRKKSVTEGQANFLKFSSTRLLRRE